MIKKRVLNKKIEDFLKDLEESKNGNPYYNQAIQITIDKINSFCNMFFDSKSARVPRIPLTQELDKIVSDLKKSRKENTDVNHKKGIQKAIKKIKDLQSNFLYDHERDPKSIFYFKNL